MKKWKVFVVPHTHWDKEWYFTKEDSDILLTSNFKQLIKLNKIKKFPTFTYDGVTSVIDDYLNYYTVSEASELIKLGQTGRVMFGPWYIQPDMFNLTSESLTRNLLLGWDMAKQYNLKKTSVAYVPDSFGHTNQLPQIFKNFGLDKFIYWRGVDTRLLNNNVLHYWKGADGTKIFAYNFYSGYWPFGGFFPYTTLAADNLIKPAKIFLTKIKPGLDELKSKIKTDDNSILVPLGGDQAPITEYLPEFIKTLNQIDTENTWTATTYDDFLNNVEYKNSSLATISGILKCPDRARIHQTIGSQRYDIKKLVKTCEYLLYEKLEPLLCYWKTMGGEIPTGEVTKNLKLLIESQAHDSLGGCCSDTTNSHIVDRLTIVKNSLRSLITKILKTISIAMEKPKNSILVFNPRLINFKAFKKLTIFTKKDSFLINNSNATDIPYVILKQQKMCEGKVITNPIHAKVDYYKTTILIKLNIEPMSFATLTLNEGDYNTADRRLNDVGQDIITNNWNIKISKNNLFVKNLKCNITLKNPYELDAVTDYGDSYDFSPPGEKEIPIQQLKTRDIQIDQNSLTDIIVINMLETYIVPESYQGKLVEQIIKKNLIFYPDGYVDVMVLIENVCKEIKWRLNIKTGFNNISKSICNQAYNVIENHVQITSDEEDWKKLNWKEMPLPIYTNESFINVKDPKTSNEVTVLTKGTNEYEITDSESAKNYNTISLTLFRSVPLLGRENLTWRPGRSSGANGHVVFTPDAELKTSLNFKIRIIYDDSMNTHPVLWNHAKSYTSNTLYYQNQSLDKLFKRLDYFILPNYDIKNKSELNSLISSKNNDFIVTSVKPHKTGQYIVVRGFNPLNDNLTTTFTYKNQQAVFYPTNMTEEITSKQYESLRVKPFEICTILIPISESNS